MADEEDIPRQEPVEPVAMEDGIGGPALPMDRYHLRAPIFSGEEDVEQLITEFSDVAAICRWPARVTLIQLRLCLTGPGKPYEIGQDVGDIFEALRARFGLTAWDTRVQLQGLRRNPKTTLREHATVVERLAQVAYGDLPANGRQSLALYAFLQSINHLGMKQHLLVAEVETMERALRLGNAYFQADSTCRPGTTVQEVKADDDVSTSSVRSAVHVATAAADEPISLTTSLVRELLAEIRHLRQQSTTERPTRADCGPRFNPPRPRPKPNRVRRPPLPEWQAPRRVSKPQGPPKPPAWALKNRFEGLPDEGLYDEWEQDQDLPRLPTREQVRAFTRPPVCEQDRDVNRLPNNRRRPPRNRKAQVHSQLHAHEVSPPDMNRSVSAQPYGSSYFLTGKLAGKAATFLLDTGCTTNLLSRRLFDTLSARDRANLEPYEGEHGTLADGSCIPFYGVIELTGRVRD